MRDSETKFNITSNEEKTIVECAKCGTRLIEMAGGANIRGYGWLACQNCESKHLKERLGIEN